MGIFKKRQKTKEELEDDPFAIDPTELDSKEVNKDLELLGAKDDIESSKDKISSKNRKQITDQSTKKGKFPKNPFTGV
jgi:hypothetical protein